jgi:hypothetical protein
MSDDYYCDFILNERVPVQVVAETKRVLAFHHVFRTWETHIVVIPKRHVRSLTDIDDPTLLTELFQVVIGIQAPSHPRGFRRAAEPRVPGGQGRTGRLTDARRGCWTRLDRAVAAR